MGIVTIDFEWVEFDLGAGILFGNDFFADWVKIDY